MNRRRLYARAAGIAAAVILAGVALATAGARGVAAPDAPGRGAPPGLMIPGLPPPGLALRAADELALTAEQRDALRALLDQVRPQFGVLHGQMRANAELLAVTRPDDSAYQSVVANVSQSTGEIASQLVLEGSRVRSEVFGLLTPDQKARLVAVEARWRDRRHAATAPAEAGEGEDAPRSGPR